MVKAKVYILEKRFEGYPKEGDLRIIEEELPAIKNGEFLAEALYLSVDPYMRVMANTVKLGQTYIGSQVAKITESKNPRFPVGQYVVADFGWRTHTISDGTPIGMFPGPVLVPKRDDVSPSLALGILGMPGNSAYFGFLEACRPREGDTVVISAAAGALGTHVGQIARIKGCSKVIGLTGSDEKGKWLVDELHFDHFINYKTADVDKALTEVVPEGVDCYYDGVGGEISSTVLRHMSNGGRVCVIGGISNYNGEGKARDVNRPLITNNVTMEGFSVLRCLDRWNKGIQQNYAWIKEGKLKYKETITEGFENMFEAFSGMLKGGNIGKAIVKV